MKYKFPTKPISWSQLSCFSNPDNDNYSDPESWFRRYVLNEKEPPSPELIFGSMIDKKIQDDPMFIPTLPRYPMMQHKVETKFGRTKLLGYLDGVDKGVIADYKTGKMAWDKKRIDKSGQLTMYATLLYLSTGIKPNDLKLIIHWLPTEKKDDVVTLKDPDKFFTFETKRTMMDVLNFLLYIKTTLKEMRKYVREYD